MSFSIQAACASHVGKKRDNNEDNFYFDRNYMSSDNRGTGSVLVKLSEKKSESDNRGTENMLGKISDVTSSFKKMFFYDSEKKSKNNKMDLYYDEIEFYAVYDGMGGGEYGEIASYTSAKETKAFFSDSNNININDITPTLQKLCTRLNQSVVNAANSMQAENVGTTIVSLLFFNGQAWICNIGDSPCFILRERTLNQISFDHVETDKSPKAMRKPYLTQYLGVNPEEYLLEPFIKSFRPQSGDIFLLCSDGLTDMVSSEIIQSILMKDISLDRMVNALIQNALDNGGRDNITVMICKVE